MEREMVNPWSIFGHVHHDVATKVYQNTHEASLSNLHKQIYWHFDKIELDSRWKFDISSYTFDIIEYYIGLLGDDHSKKIQDYRSEMETAQNQ